MNKIFKVLFIIIGAVVIAALAAYLIFEFTFSPLKPIDIIGLAAILIIAIVGFTAFMVYAHKKGWNLQEIGAEIEKDIGIAESLATALIPFAGPYGKILSQLCSFVNAAVDQVSKFYTVNLVAADQRKAAATNLVLKDLADANIPVDDNLKKLISLLIEDIYQVPKIAATANSAAGTATQN